MRQQRRRWELGRSEEADLARCAFPRCRGLHCVSGSLFFKVAGEIQPLVCLWKVLRERAVKTSSLLRHSSSCAPLAPRKGHLYCTAIGPQKQAGLLHWDLGGGDFIQMGSSVSTRKRMGRKRGRERRCGRRSSTSGETGAVARGKRRAPVGRFASARVCGPLPALRLMAAIICWLRACVCDRRSSSRLRMCGGSF